MRVLLVLMVLLAGRADAGAWPRDKGHGFASASFRLGQDPQYIGLVPPTHYTTFYLEYGLTDRVTAGLDLGRAVSGRGKTVAFARYPIGSADAANKFAVELGAGMLRGEAVLRPGLSYGRGFGTPLGPAWVAVDAIAELRPRPGDADFKIDATFGITRPGGRKTIFQLQTGAPWGDPMFARLSTSTVIPLPGRRHFEFGVTTGLKGDKQVGLLVGLWQEF